MIVCVIGPPVSCQVFSFGDAKVSKKKYAMLMLTFFFSPKNNVNSFFFPKKSDIFGQLDVVMRIMVTAIGGLVEVLESRGLLKIYLNNIILLTK